MPAASLLFQRTATELMDAVRRMMQDINPAGFGTPEAREREVMYATIVEVAHELGFDPRTPLNAAGTSLASYTLAAGATETATLLSEDLIASGDVYLDRSYLPLLWVKREQLENWINADTKLSGSVTRGVPRFCAMATRQESSGKTETKLMVYPAADQSTVLYWPRTLFDLDALSTTTRKLPFNAGVCYAIERLVASDLLFGMREDDAKRIGIDKTALAQEYKQKGMRGLNNEKASRGWLTKQSEPEWIRGV